MKKIKITSEVISYAQVDELSAKDAALVASAVDATYKAYAPYSEFYVGAALSFANGQKLQGSNQENAAYPSGLCAERVALFAAGHQHPNEVIESLAITARSDKHDTSKPVIPCGACLQVIAEYERKQEKPIRILLHGTSGEVYECDGVKNLMPFLFVLK